MLQAIKELGELKLKMEGRDASDILSILVQNPNQDGRYPKVLVIVFEKINNEYKYSHISIEETSTSKIKKYLYRRGASMGPDFTPTAKITDDIKNKTFKNKIKGWFKEVKTDDQLVLGVKTAIIESENNIISGLLNKWDEIKTSLQRNQSGIITLAIKEDHNLKYIGDFTIFRDLLVQSIKEDYQKIAKRGHCCSICGEKKDEVYGNAIPIPFYTLDKPGYIAGGFHKEKAWKNAPICLDCSLKIEEGKKFLDETKTLSPKMGRQRYYLIPKFILGIEGIEKIIESFFMMTSRPKETLTGKSLERISKDENEMLHDLSKMEDLLTFNFLFYETPTKSTFRITLLVENVLPSRVNKIFEVKLEAEKPDIFKNLRVKKDKYESVKFDFDEFRRFAPSRKVFLEVVDRTFRGVNIEPDFLFSWLWHLSVRILLMNRT